MNGKTKIVWSIVLLLMVVLLIVPLTGAGCKKGAEAEKVIRVGQMNPLTGPGAPWGIPCVRGVELLAEIINEAGGVKVGKDTYTIRIYSEDDKFTAEAGKAAFDKLVDVEKVKYIVGNFADAPILTYRGLLKEKGIIALQGSSGAANTIGPDYPYLFRFSQSPRGKLGVLDIVKDKYGDQFTKMAIIDPDNATGQGNVEAATKWAKGKGIEVVATQLYPPGTKDYYPFLSPILDKKPFMIHGAVSPGDMGLVMKQAYEKGYRGLYSNVGSLTNVGGLIDIGGEAAVQGFVAPYEVIDAPVITPESQAIMQKMKDKWLARWSPPFEPLAWRYAVGLQVLVQALEMAGTFEPEKVIQALETGTFHTILGSGSFTGKQTYGINRQLSIVTIAGIIKGRDVAYLGEVRITEP